MTGEYDEQNGADGGGSGPSSHLRAVSGPLAPPEGDLTPPPVRLRREFKGLTVADLQRDEIVAKLPGQARSALDHIERGDLAAAERALPGHYANVLAGPGHRRKARWGWLLLAGALGVVAASALWSYLQALT